MVDPKLKIGQLYIADHFRFYLLINIVLCDETRPYMMWPAEKFPCFEYSFYILDQKQILTCILEPERAVHHFYPVL